MSLDIWLHVEGIKGASGTGVFVSVFDANITYNVTAMWKRAGCYGALYESGGKRARDILPTLESAYEHMRDNPRAYEVLNPLNGWGSYETALPWLWRLMVACREYPDAVIGVSA